MEKRDGAGENTDREIGSAGIKYMEKVVERAILDSEAFEGLEEVGFDGDYLKAVDELEETLMSDSDTIEDIFRELEYTPDALEDEELVELFYKGESVIVTYKHLNDVYNEKIFV